MIHTQEFIQKNLDFKKIVIMPPSIDPLSEKNRELKEYEISKILNRFDIKEENPIITQVSRFDPWKGIDDVINVYLKVKEKFPNVQLLLVGILTQDDPEGHIFLNKTIKKVENDYNVHILTDLIGVHNKEVNALQRASDVVLQMSKKEGFGLTVSEAMWKEKAVIGKRVGGIKIQIKDGESGFLIENINEAIEKQFIY